MGRVEGKVAVVTGGASGIGAAIVRALHAEGARVVIADITGAQDALASELGDGALGVEADVSTAEGVRGMLEVAVEEFGGLHVLCNNAGIDGPASPLHQYPIEEFDRVLGVNVRAVFLGTQAALPIMIEGGGGSIVNTASIAGMVAFPGLSAYVTAKAGVVGLTKATAVEYATAGIRCNALCPGVVRTAMMAHFEHIHPEEAAQLVGAAQARTPQQRIAAPSELAGAAVFLASDESSFLTGATLNVDGGYTAV